jgi:hypothetical protein
MREIHELADSELVNSALDLFYDLNDKSQQSKLKAQENMDKLGDILQELHERLNIRPVLKPHQRLMVP